jgi:hypothetical protein
MRLNDGSADGQSHAHSLGFRRKERLEDAFKIRPADPSSGIFDGNEYAMAIGLFAANSEYPGTIIDRAHGLNGIGNQVEQDLLQLNAHGRYTWHIAS